MIVKILEKSATFSAVEYNTDKIEEGIAELVTVQNFGALESLTGVRPADYINYLKAVSAQSKRVIYPQLHVAISALGKTVGKLRLIEIANAWMNMMHYGRQPYLVFFHKDTGNNHIHIVSTRVNQEGKKISSAFERVRAVKAINQLTGLNEKESALKDIEKARSYSFSTLPQFKLLLERQGYSFKENQVIKFGRKLSDVDFEKLAFNIPDQRRAHQLNAIFHKYRGKALESTLKEKFGVDLVFHSKDGKPAYGYTVIDHARKNVFKGSDIMKLSELSKETAPFKTIAESATPQLNTTKGHSLNINISKDVDDEKTHGRKRKKKGRTR